MTNIPKSIVLLITILFLLGCVELSLPEDTTIDGTNNTSSTSGDGDTGNGSTDNSGEIGNNALLLKSAKEGDFNNAEYALEQGADVDTQDPDTGDTALILSVTSISGSEINFAPRFDAQGIEESRERILEAQKRKEQIFIALMARNARVNLRNRNDESALKRAVDGKSIFFTGELIRAKADVDTKDKWGRTPLMSAAELGETETTTKLLESGADTNLKDIHGITALMLAVSNGHTKIITLLKNYGANELDIDKLDTAGMTALMHAIKDMQIETALALIEIGADVTLKDEQSWNTLHYATRYNLIEVIPQLILAGADINPVSRQGWSPLHFAVEYSEPSMTALLIKEGAIVDDIRNFSQRTPLMIAAKAERLDVVKVLISEGADVNAKSKNGITALWFATDVKAEDVVDFLLKKGANVNSADIGGYTALMNIWHGGDIIGELLIAAGAEINIQNKNGMTALHISVEANSKEAVEFLLTKNPDLNIVDFYGNSAWSFAKQLGYDELAGLLELAGSDTNM